MYPFARKTSAAENGGAIRNAGDINRQDETKGGENCGNRLPVRLDEFEEACDSGEARQDDEERTDGSGHQTPPLAIHNFILHNI